MPACKARHYNDGKPGKAVTIVILLPGVVWVLYHLPSSTQGTVPWVHQYPGYTTHHVCYRGVLRLRQPATAAWAQRPCFLPGRVPPKQRSCFSVPVSSAVPARYPEPVRAHPGQVLDRSRYPRARGPRVLRAWMVPDQPGSDPFDTGSGPF